MNAHVYSEDPAQRFVFINGTSYRVGQRIEVSGPLVYAITPEGVVLDYGEGKTSIPVRK